MSGGGGDAQFRDCPARSWNDRDPNPGAAWSWFDPNHTLPFDRQRSRADPAAQRDCARSELEYGFRPQEVWEVQFP